MYFINLVGMCHSENIIKELIKFCNTNKIDTFAYQFTMMGQTTNYIYIKLKYNDTKFLLIRVQLDDTLTVIEYDGTGARLKSAIKCNNGYINLEKMMEKHETKKEVNVSPNIESVNTKEEYSFGKYIISGIILFTCTLIAIQLISSRKQ